MNKLEVIAWTVDDAVRIEKGGADRIELVVDLDRGGLTPPRNLVEQVLNSVRIPVRVMVRDTDKSFTYDEITFNQMLLYIEAIKELRPEGIVFGSITEDGLIDFNQLRQVIEAKGDMKLTFHRAFDELDQSIVMDQFDQLSRYEVDTILSSGTEKTALEGAETLKQLVNKQSINILPGSGINLDNYKEVLKKTKANYLHVGYAVRDNDGNIDIDKVKQMKEGINND